MTSLMNTLNRLQTKILNKNTLEEWRALFGLLLAYLFSLECFTFKVRYFRVIWFRANWRFRRGYETSQERNRNINFNFDSPAVSLAFFSSKNNTDYSLLHWLLNSSFDWFDGKRRKISSNWIFPSFYQFVSYYHNYLSNVLEVKLNMIHFRNDLLWSRSMEELQYCKLRNRLFNSSFLYLFFCL